MTDLSVLAQQIRSWGRELGFQQIGFTDTDLSQAEERLQQWLTRGHHADMDWMAAHGTRRSRPELLEDGTLRVISARMDYLPDDGDPIATLQQPDQAYIARYALGRDYHKLMRRRLARLADRIRAAAHESGLARAFVDSAPVMEKPLAEKAGLGWQGKHTLLINHEAGSWFFLGEIYTDLALPIDAPGENRCGRCSACMTVCPTNAIIAPYQLDARLCISWLTIENKGAIPERLRPLMGNRIFGCDDCQLMCPWNRFAHSSSEDDFAPRHGLEQSDLVTLFNWTEEEFLKNTEGSAIRRTGYEGWLRNIAVALGNGPASPEAIQALRAKKSSATDLVAEHCQWALSRLSEKSAPAQSAAARRKSKEGLPPGKA